MSGWRFILSLGCFIIGILIALQFEQQEKVGFPLAAYRPVDLIRMVKDSERTRGELQTQVEQLRARLAEYEFARSGRGNISRVLLEELERARLEAGLVPVHGPGIRVILDDSKQRPRGGEDDYFYLVHDVDLNQLVNELWGSGAEAITINGQRVVANSAIRCVGPTILVNAKRLGPPYRVDAIGDPDTLAGGLKMRGGFLDAMAVSIRHGVSALMTKEENLELPAYGGPMTFHYASPLAR